MKFLIRKEMEKLLKFEGEYLTDRKWNGKRYDPFGEIVYEIKNGNKEEKQ